MKKRGIRNTNIELLRIFSMLLIVLYHIVRRYKVYDSLISFPSGAYFSDLLLGIWGIFGVYIFIVISAWFQLDSKFCLKKVISVVCSALFYIVIFGIIRTGLIIMSGNVTVFSAVLDGGGSLDS